MSFQSQEEIIRVADDWVTHFAPADMIQNKANMDVLAAYIRIHFGGVVTASNLTYAEQALRAAGKLQLVVPKSAEQVQIDAINEQQERWKKQHYDALAQTKERNFASEAREEAERKRLLKEQADADKTIEFEINRYQANHPRLAGHIDYARTEQFRRDLRKIEVRKNGKRDAVLTLKAVREAISNLPG